MTMKINDNGTDRDMTETEQTAFAEWQKIALAEVKAEAKELAERAEAKQAVLDRLGITADEAALLLG
jgi:hypothetical protein